MPTLDITDDTLFDPISLIAQWENQDFTSLNILFCNALTTLREAALNHLCDNESGNAFPAFLKAYDSQAHLFAAMRLHTSMEDVREQVNDLFRRTALSGFTRPEREEVLTYMLQAPCPNATVR